MSAAWHYDKGMPCGAAANAAKYLAGEAGFQACEQAVMTHGGFGYAKEFHVERYLREVLIPRIAPISPQLALSFVAEKVLGCRSPIDAVMRWDRSDSGDSAMANDGPAVALDFAGIIRAGDVVVCGQATAEPRSLTEALIAQKSGLPPFTMVVGPIFSDTFTPERVSGIDFVSYGVIGQARLLPKAGAAACRDPQQLRCVLRRLRYGRHRADVVLVQLAEGSDGRLSASLSNDYVMMLRAARALSSRRYYGCALTFGAEWPEDIVPHLRVACTRPPLELPSTGLDDVSLRIAGTLRGSSGRKHLV
jgi:hypothetical protein